MGEEVYIDKVQKLGWDDLSILWQAIKAGKTPGWPAGKALEYLVIRALQLDGAEVRWPFNYVEGGQILEQIDGAIYLNGLAFLAESKDYQDRINIEPIAKLKAQLSRRPPSTLGIFFSKSGYTEPALTLAQFLGQPPVLLWNGDE
ncbi:restriction endonuclease, partial [candidate division KSB1 bacterium]|nr:restriction endonuclease [candidate division KSB1 bacterium]